jgi:hypothetical protein
MLLHYPEMRVMVSSYDVDVIREVMTFPVIVEDVI